MQQVDNVKETLQIFTPINLEKKLTNTTDSERRHLDNYWEQTNSAYPFYPSVRHRHDWVRKQINRHIKRSLLDNKELQIFDFGCGEGSLLLSLLDQFDLSNENAYGFDLSSTAIKLANQRFGSKNFFDNLEEAGGRTFHVIICCEVIEHTYQYRKMLKWIYQHLKEDGILLLTTQSGKIHKSDLYAGHTQHFCLKEISSLIEGLGYEVSSRKSWGFPFFTLQKYLTNLNFQLVQEQYLEATPGFKQRFIFSLAYFFFRIHNYIAWGPQLFIVAQKKPH